jgi:hypothetical protein
VSVDYSQLDDLPAHFLSKIEITGYDDPAPINALNPLLADIGEGCMEAEAKLERNERLDA